MNDLSPLPTSGPLPPWYKRQFPLWVRGLLLTIALFFVAGGAVNDGLTGWFWALPFLYLFYRMLATGKQARILLTSLLFLLMVLMSHFSWESPLVYPVIGEGVIAKEDIQTTTYKDTHHANYDGYPDFHTGYEYLERKDVVPQASIGKVKKISQGTEDLGAYPVFVVAFPSGDVYVAQRDIMNKVSALDEGDRSFCGKVEWSFCMSGKVADPMRLEFRFLASLMYYPVLPLMFPTLLHK